MTRSMSIERRNRALALALALLAGAAHATDVRIPAIFDSAGEPVSARGSVILVWADGTQASGLMTTDGSQLTDRTSITLDGTDVVLNLTPQALIATDGASTYYRIRIADGARLIADYSVQVPVSDAEQQLSDLVGAAAIDPADVASGRLIPSGGDAGQLLAKTASTDYAVAWITAAGTGDMLASVYDPQGIGGDAFSWSTLTDTPTTCDGYGITDCGGVSAHDAVTLSGAYDYLTLSGQELVRGPIDLTTDVTGSLPVAAVSGLSAVATSGAYADLSGTPTLGTAAATSITDYATATQGSQGATAFGWGDHSAVGYLTEESDPTAYEQAADAVSFHELQTDPHTQYAQTIDLGTAAYTASSDYALAAQGALADTALQPATAGAAGIQPWEDFGNVSSGTVSLVLDGQAARVRLTGDADLAVTGSAAGELRYAVLYVETDGLDAWELSTPFSARWLDGAPSLISPATGEIWEVAMRMLPTGVLLLSARPWY